MKQVWFINHWILSVISRFSGIKVMKPE